MAWVRSLLVIATTLAASRYHLLAVETGSCFTGSIFAACADVDMLVGGVHVIAPLMVPSAFVVFTRLPTLLLASRGRVWGLWAATGRLLLICLALLASSLAYLRASKAWGYALSVHLAVLFLCQESRAGLLFGQAAHAAAKAAALVFLLVGAWQLGPPLPAWDAPGLPGCCGAVAHMGAWAAAETLGRAAVALEGWWRAGDWQINPI